MHMSAAERLRRLEEAKAFLRQQLVGSPQPARAMLKAAKAAGIAKRTLHRAKASLGVQVHRDGWGKRGRWVWLPLTVMPVGQNLPTKTLSQKVMQEAVPGT
jgi:hypothetical protein